MSISVCVYLCGGCHMCGEGVHGGQKRVSDPLELELHRDGSCHVGAGN